MFWTTRILCIFVLASVLAVLPNCFESHEAWREACLTFKLSVEQCVKLLGTYTIFFSLDQISFFNSLLFYFKDTLGKCLLKRKRHRNLFDFFNATLTLLWEEVIRLKFWFS